MTQQADIPVFGTPPADGPAVVRPSAYGLVTDATGRLAVVRTPHGLFLPGGGIEAGETPHEAVRREVREECGLDVQVGTWCRQAVDFVYSLAERTDFEKRSTFIDARPSGRRAVSQEPDHALEWVAPSAAIDGLAHPSHRWAVAEWIGRTGSA